jgi:hypothetical protein
MMDINLLLLSNALRADGHGGNYDLSASNLHLHRPNKAMLVFLSSTRFDIPDLGNPRVVDIYRAVIGVFADGTLPNPIYASLARGCNARTPHPYFSMAACILPDATAFPASCRILTDGHASFHSGHLGYLAYGNGISAVPYSLVVLHYLSNLSIGKFGMFLSFSLKWSAGIVPNFPPLSRQSRLRPQMMFRYEGDKVPLPRWDSDLGADYLLSATAGALYHQNEYGVDKY